MKDLSISIREKGKKEDRTAEISLEGDLTIAHVDNFRDKLLDVMENYPKMELKVQNVESIDLSIIQLLVSAGKTMGPEKFRMSAHLSDDLKKLMLHAGFDEVLDS